MNESELKGKKIITIISVVMVIIALLGLVSSCITGNLKISSIVRSIITLVIVYFLYLGKNWARITMVVLTAISGVMSVLVGIVGFISSPVVGGIYILSAAISLALAITLGVNTSVKEYFDCCKNQ